MANDNLGTDGNVRKFSDKRMKGTRTLAADFGMTIAAPMPLAAAADLVGIILPPPEGHGESFSTQNESE